MAAGTSREAMKVGPEFKPDVLVVDWVLNEQFNGLDVAVALRRTDGLPKTILVSGYPSSEIESLMAKQHIKFLAKPFGPEDLLAMVRDADPNLSSP